MIATECVDEHGVIDTGSADASCDPDWALKHTGLAAAKARIRAERHEEPGEGIVIASLDTGYTEHPELDSAILEDRGYAFECDARYDGRKGAPQPCTQPERLASDRLKGGLPFMKQPGHGTGTISVLISPDGPTVPASPNTNARVSGAAPGARVVPMRTIDGIILWEGRAWNMARAISRVILDDPAPGREPQAPAVDVISMSVGRRAPYSHLEKAVLLAERRGVIVVAASGQGPWLPEQGSVRFPANYPSVLAVSGVDVNTHPWDYRTAGGVNWLWSAGQGRGVDVAAPAVNVWRAQTTGEAGNVEFRIGRGTGTSFATPLVAGAAALWLQWYGRDDLQVRYGRSALSAAFQVHLRQSGVRTPVEMAQLASALGLPNAARIEDQSKTPWNTVKMGAGILAADKLIARDFKDLPTREDVCDYVYEQRGAEGLASVCPPRDCPAGDPHADCGHDSLALGDILAATLRRPAYHYDPHNSYVFSLTVGAPFGSGEGEWYSPVVSVGLIRSRHQYQNPEGLLFQAKGGEHGFGVGIGYAIAEEYGPHRNEEDKYATIPGFGVMLGFSARAGYLRTAGTDHVGLELGFAYTRTKVNIGLYRGLGSNPPETWRWTVDAGFGF